MNKLEKQSVQGAIQNIASLIRKDMGFTGSLPKALRKKLRQDRIKALQNNAFNKDKK